ncbi:GNAT family N-acetyltransferase [Jannaschia sp. CCS1]|uniref:GNAT family N-acetyltransferase n=1 Tax=Jannaschia sp. (strain CCS1) TaxID=290400 RepID=UPI00140FC63F|nr:GNAT family N-acetyltransferase [Jannaschia sp. CCS1]
MDLAPIQTGFPEDQRHAAAKLFWQAFGGKLGKLLGPEPRALAFLTPVLDPNHCLSQCDTDGVLVGLAGFKTAQGSFVGGRFRDLVRVYGTGGALWRAPLLAMVERPVEEGTLLMDGIAVTPRARGLGIGTTLLDGIAAEAARRGNTHVRLDVIDTNPRARALYERRGFKPLKDEDIFPFRWLFGFSRATQMAYSVTPSN